VSTPQPKSNITTEQLDAVIDPMLPELERLQRYFQDAMPTLSDEGFHHTMMFTLSVAEQLTNMCMESITKNLPIPEEAQQFLLEYTRETPRIQLLRQLVRLGNTFDTADEIRHAYADEFKEAQLNEQAAKQYEDEQEEERKRSQATMRSMSEDILDF